MMKKNLSSGILPQKQKGLVRLLFNLPAGELNSGHLRKIAEISKKHGTGYISLTLRQNFELPGVPEGSVQEVLREMSLAGFYPGDRQVLENVVSCPGADQCGLALMKTLGLAVQIDEHLKKRSSLPRNLTINLSGCSNGCTHPLINEIGLVGAGGRIENKKVFGFDVHLGGSHDENRLGERIGFVPDGKVLRLLDKLMEIFEREGKKGETFLAFVHEREPSRIQAWIEEEKDLLYPSITKERD